MLQQKTINVIMVYDEQLVADCLNCILSTHNVLKVTGLLRNDEDILQRIPAHRPDIIIFMFSRWKTKYLKLMANVHSKFPGIKILVISESVSHEIMRDLMSVINGFVLRTCSSSKVILAIQEMYVAGKYLCPEVVDEYFSEDNTVENDVTLTNREKEILCAWIETKGNNEIANNLNISRSTVRTHLNNIRQKLGNLNHLEIMIYACRHNLLRRNFKPICPNCKFFYD